MKVDVQCSVQHPASRSSAKHLGFEDAVVCMPWDVAIEAIIVSIASLKFPILRCARLGPWVTRSGIISLPLTLNISLCTLAFGPAGGAHLSYVCI